MEIRGRLAFAALAFVSLASCQEGLNDPVSSDQQPALIALATDVYLEALARSLSEGARPVVIGGISDLQLALSEGTRGQVSRALGTIESGLAQSASTPEVVESINLVASHIRSVLEL